MKPESVPKPKGGSTPKCDSTPERSVEEEPHVHSCGQTKTARGGFAIQLAGVTDKDIRKETISLSVATAQNGDTVSVHYVGKFPGGKVFDTSMRAEAEKSGLFNPARDYKPLQVVLGKHQVIIGFEEALIGMKVNETKEITLPPEKAYGRTGRHPMAGKTLQFRLLLTNIRKSA